MLTTTLALIAFLFPLAYSPGPGNMFFAANGARFGLRATLPANAGYHIATWIVTLAIGLGLMTALEQAPQVFTALKFAGAAYVMWLAWKLLRAGTARAMGQARPARFRDGVILLVLNPKAYVIIALMFTQFLDRTVDNVSAQVLLITSVFTLNNFVAFTLWTLAGDRLAALFASPQSAARLNTLLGVILAGVALWMLLS